LRMEELLESHILEMTMRVARLETNHVEIFRLLCGRHDLTGEKRVRPSFYDPGMA
jgi:hypothetical protein